VLEVCTLSSDIWFKTCAELSNKIVGQKTTRRLSGTEVAIFVHGIVVHVSLCGVVVGSSSDVSGFGLDGSSVDKSRNSFRFVRVVLCNIASRELFWKLKYVLKWYISYHLWVCDICMWCLVVCAFVT